MEWECFWVNIREDNKVSESKMAAAEFSMARIKDGCHHQVESEWMSEVYSVQNGPIQDDRIQDGCHHQVELEWMRLSQMELVWVRVLCKMAESKMAEFKMAEIQDGCHHQVESEWMSDVIRGITKMVESKTAKFKMTAVIKLSENEGDWLRLN